jgi:DNA primase
VNEITKNRFIHELKHHNIRWNNSGNNIMIMCPFHNDTSYSLGITWNGGKYENSKIFNCLSCHERGPIWYLYKYLFELEELNEEFFEEETIKQDLSEIRERIYKIRRGDSQKDKIKVLKNFDINRYKRPTMEYAQYLKKRKLTKQTCREFNIRGGMWKGDKRILIPMKDEYGRLISMYGRSIRNDGKGKVIKSKNSDVGKILFNLNKAKIFKYCVLTEGEIDALYLWQYKIPTVSAGTTSLTDWQLYKLSVYFETVFLALDGSVKKKIWLKTLRQIQEYIPIVKQIQLPFDKDPNELDEKEVYKNFGHLVYNRS